MDTNIDPPIEIINEEIILDNTNTNTKIIPTLTTYTPEYYQKIKEIHEYIKGLTYYMNLHIPMPCPKCNKILEYECIDCTEQK